MYGAIFVGLLLLHIFIFRDVVAAIPAILAGNAVIVREELVPFFQFGSQFWGDGASALTSSEEVRVTYSFWTAWVRYYQILPFAIILLNALSAFILFYAFHRIGRYFYKKSLFGVLLALAAALLIHTIMLYAKIAHFYVLIIGFSMFALSLSLLCEQIFFKTRIKAKNVAAVSLLTLLNPAIHYHVIFYVVFTMIIVMHLIFTLLMNRSYLWFYLKKSGLYFLLIILFSLVPYALYIMLTTSNSMGDVSTQIPVNYWMIYYASLSLPFIFSLDTAGHLDLMRYGNYLAPFPRIGTMIVTILVGAIFMFKRWRYLHIVEQIFIITMFSVLLLAMWMTLGYSPNSPYSFHHFLGHIALFFDGLGTGIGSTVSSLIGTFINILRFPHRFQFIYFYIAGVLFVIVMYWLRDILMRRFKLTTATIIIVVIALLPIIMSKDYRTAMFSGDLATFAAPYTIPEDLKHIKTTLEKQKKTKLFVLPTLESGREIVTKEKNYSFLDKFLIFYLNQPTLYYGVGANTENKIHSYLVYRAIAYNEKWWEDILINNLGITNILVPKHIKPRDGGVMYMKDIEQKIDKSFTKAKKFKKTYAGKDYDLYAAIAPRNEQKQTLVDMEWSNLSKYLNDEDKKDSSLLFPLQLSKHLKQQQKFRLTTDSPERSFYDLSIATQPKYTVTPLPRSLPFSPEYVASSNFTNNALSLSTLYAKNDQYNYLKENVPSLVNLQRPAFVGLTKGKVELEVSLTAPKAGKYRLLLHGASKGNNVEASLGSTRVKLTKLKDDQGKKGDYIDFTYFAADVELEAGKQVIRIKNTTQNAVLVDSMTLLPAEAIPKDFARVGVTNLTIQPTAGTVSYDVVARRAQ